MKLNNYQKFAPGTLVDWQIKNLEDIQILQSISPSCIQPTSIDMQMLCPIYQLSGVPPLSPQGFDPEATISRFGVNNAFIATPQSPATLMQHGVYLAQTSPIVDMPEHLVGYFNPKSSTGRLGVTTLAIRQGETMFNTS